MANQKSMEAKQTKEVKEKKKQKNKRIDAIFIPTFLSNSRV